MDFLMINVCGLVLIGCGCMGGVLLDGWLKNGLLVSVVYVIDFNVRLELVDLGVLVNGELFDDLVVLVIVVKLQMMGDVLLCLMVGVDMLVLFVVVGVMFVVYQVVFLVVFIVCLMFNMFVVIGQGIIVIIGNVNVFELQMVLVEGLLFVVGCVVCLQVEDQMDVVIVLLGFGLVYVFYMIEVMVVVGQVEGLFFELVLELVCVIVVGVGVLVILVDEDLVVLCQNVIFLGGMMVVGLV